MTPLPAVSAPSRRYFLQGAALVGGVGALAACGGQQSADEQASGAAAEESARADAAADLPATGWTRADYDDVADGGSLRIAVSQLPSNWNINHPDGSIADLSTVRGPLGGWAELRFLEDGSAEPNPDYVTSAALISEDPQVVAVSFNPAAKWDDGTPITVADLISEWGAKNGTNPAFTVATTKGWDQIAEIRQGADEFTCEIHYSAPYADWISIIHPDVPQAVTATPEAFATGWITSATPGKGPFTVTQIDPTAGVVTMGRNEHWWGRAPKLETIIFSVVSSTQMPATFANGEIDLIEISDGDVLTQAKGRADAQIQTTNGTAWSHLTLNTQGGNGALSDPVVREAAARAINREAVGRAIVGPLEAPVVLQNHLIYLPGQRGYEDSFAAATGSPLAYDPEAAAELLEGAGWELNGDVREKDGAPLAMAITVPADSKTNSDRATQMMNDLNAVGFQVELAVVPLDSYFSEYIANKTFDMVTFSWLGTSFAETNSTNYNFPMSSSQNYTNLDQDAELKPYADVMLGSPDKDARVEAAEEFSKIVATGYASIPLYTVPNIYGVTEGLVNTGAAQFETTDWTQVGFAG